MKKWTFAVVVAVFVVTAVFWFPKESVDPERPTPKPESTVPAIATATEATESPSNVPETPTEGIAKVVPPAPVDRDGLEKRWTAERLAGTTWKGTGFDFSFAEDGTWYMAGRAASKWKVEGDRIKLFDDKGEVHYIEIEGDTLTFNGESIGQPVAN